MKNHELSQYLKTQTSLFDPRYPIEVQRLSQENDKYVEGYLNFVYRVRQKGHSYIVKHAKLEIASSVSLGQLDPKRNYYEYLTYQLRHELTPQMVPVIYHGDAANDLFIMEDLQEFMLLRFALTGNRIGWDFGSAVGSFLARSHFHTSRFHLSPAMHQREQQAFHNDTMRETVTGFILAKDADTAFEGYRDETMQQIRQALLQDTAFAAAWDQLVADFSHCDCLIHGDFHSSNIFVSLQKPELKVIDMEYTMSGPFAYDLGYFIANLISQYAAYVVEPATNHATGTSQQTYLLTMLANVFNSYFSVFRNLAGQKLSVREAQQLFRKILREALGYSALTNIGRTANGAPFPDFDRLAPEMAVVAKGLSLKISSQTLMCRDSYEDIQDFITGIQQITADYFQALTT